MRWILVKTFKASDYKHALSLLENGELFFQHVANYQNMTGDIQRGDSEEGTTVEHIPICFGSDIKRPRIGRPDSKIFSIDFETARIAHPQLSNMPGVLKITYTVDWLIYCMTYVSSSTPNRSKIYETISKLGEFSVVILDCDSFIRRIICTTRIEKMGAVRYTDDAIDDPFTKRRTYFSGQNEYRFAISADGAKTKKIQVGAVASFICLSKDISKVEEYLS